MSRVFVGIDIHDPLGRLAHKRSPNTSKGYNIHALTLAHRSSNFVPHLKQSKYKGSRATSCCTKNPFEQQLWVHGEHRSHQRISEELPSHEKKTYQPSRQLSKRTRRKGAIALIKVRKGIKNEDKLPISVNEGIVLKDCQAHLQACFEQFLPQGYRSNGAGVCLSASNKSDARLMENLQWGLLASDPPQRASLSLRFIISTITMCNKFLNCLELVVAVWITRFILRLVPSPEQVRERLCQHLRQSIRPSTKSGQSVLRGSGFNNDIIIQGS